MRGGVKSALVIDDDEDIREVLRTMLEAAGFYVDVLTDGIDALKLTSWYDVILLDWKMPVFDGQRLTDYWQLTDPTLLRRVIILSGYSRLTLDQQPPTFAILPKPFDYKALMHVVERCITTPLPVEVPGETNV